MPGGASLSLPLPSRANSTRGKMAYYSWANTMPWSWLCSRRWRRYRLQPKGSPPVAAGPAHLHLIGPWPYKLSELYDAPAVSAAVKNLAAEEHAKVAA
jgi:hypothetical protein